MIEIDATEARANTKLPNAASYHSVTGLERLTGADILVHPFSSLPDKLLDIPPHLAALRQRTAAGVLIQRKSGSDFISSIEDLGEILFRMKEWSPNPWLLPTNIRKGKNNTVIVTGSRRKQTYRWPSISGAFDSWAHSGGSVKRDLNDSDIPDWLRALERKVKEWQQKPVKTVVHKTAQRPIAKEDQNWYNTGKAWPPGIGERMLAELAKYIQNTLELPPTLANAICVACSSVATNVKLWGPKSAGTVREWWGVDRAILPQDWGVQSGAWLYSTNLVELPSAFHDVRLYTGNGTFYLISGELYEDRKVPIEELREEGK
jgi:hypothetical protein